jgi:hypothetical protein
MQDSLGPLAISTIRTVVMPTVAGFVLQLLVLVGADDPSPEARASLTALLAAAWYILARFLESKNRYWGALLLVAVQPSYDSETEGQVVLAVQRTVVPLAVGWLVTQAAVRGLDIDASTLALSLQALVTTGYYGLLRRIESSKPGAGVLLGGRTTLTY